MLRKLLVLASMFILSCATLVAYAPARAQATCSTTPITLRLDDWSSADRVEYMNQVLASFTQENPCIKVSAEPNIGDDQNTRRLTMIASGTAPDLIGAG